MTAVGLHKAEGWVNPTTVSPSGILFIVFYCLRLLLLYHILCPVITIIKGPVTPWYCYKYHMGPYHTLGMIDLSLCGRYNISVTRCQSILATYIIWLLDFSTCAYYMLKIHSSVHSLEHQFHKEGYFNKLGVNAIWLTPHIEQIKYATDESTGWTYGFHGYW